MPEVVIAHVAEVWAREIVPTLHDFVPIPNSRRASLATFGKPSQACGEGGTIPFMGMLGRQFPDAQFVITGALGPGSTAHGPNEFLDLVTGERLTAAIAMLLRDHTRR